MNFIPTDRRLKYDVDDETTNVGKIASKFAKAKKSGGGWGALVGGILGQILIPIPGVGAAIGAGIGGAGGSIVGGHLSGVTQDDIREGKFKKNSREDILKTIGRNQMNQSLMSAAQYGFAALNPSSAFSKGTDFLKEGGVQTFMSEAGQYGVKEAGQHAIARGSEAGAAKYGDVLARNITEQGLSDNPWLTEGGDAFFDDYMLNPAQDLSSPEPGLYSPRIPNI
jgi:hypothetical protein